jgi:hypothetical protein
VRIAGGAAGRTLAIGVVAALLAALAPVGEVVGASESSGLDAQRLVAAAKRAGTIRFRGTSKTTFGGGTESTGRFSGVVDLRDLRAEESMREAMRNTKPRHVETVRFRQRVVGDHRYLSPADVIADPPGIAGVRPNTEGKAWVRIPYSVDGARGLLAVSAGDPLVDVSGPDAEVEEVGPARVHDVPVTHWRVTTRENPPAQVRRSGRTRGRDRVVDLWVDHRDRVRRMVTVTKDDDLRSVVRVDYYGFGAPVSIEEPASDTVAVDDQFLLKRDWHLVQKGRVRGDAWRLFRAETESGSCFAHETEPAVRTIGRALQRGRSTELCTIVASGAPAPPDVPLQTDAFPLANGMAVFYGTVSDRAERVIVRTSDGRVARLVAKEGTFALPLGHDETVRRIVIEGHGKRVRCPSAPRGNFDCHGSLSDQPATPVFPPTPEMVPPEPTPTTSTTAPPEAVPGA